VPQGNNEIVFKFEPASYKLGNKISYTSSTVFILLTIGYIALTTRKKRQTE